MNRFIRLAAALLGAALAFTACSGGTDESPSSQPQNEGAAAMGRYVEEAAALPDDVGGIAGSARLADGTLLLLTDAQNESVTSHNWSLYASKDSGKSWETRPVPLFSENKDNLFVSGAAFDSEGNLFLAYSIITQEYIDMMNEAIKTGVLPENADPENILVKIAPDGSSATLPLEWKADEGGRITVYDMAVSEDGDLFVNHMDSVVRYDLSTGKPKMEYPGTDSGTFLIHDGALVSAGEEGLIQYDLETADQGETIPPGGAGGRMTLFTGIGGKDLLLCDGSGIYRWAPAEASWERLMDGAVTSLSMPSVSISGALQTDEQRFLILTYAENTAAAAVYRFDPDMPAQPPQTMTVYALRDNDTIRQTAGLYQVSHPETRVAFTPALAEESALTEADALRTLNTELLAGKGPDILVLDGLPFSSYIEKGVLADLAPALKAELDSGALARNIAGVYEKDGVIPIAPARFSAPVLYGSKACVDSARDFPALADWASAEHQKTGLRQFQSLHPAALIREFYYTCAPAWRAQDGSIQKEEFSVFLENIKKIADTSGDPALEAAPGADAAQAAQNDNWAVYAAVSPWASIGSQEYYENLTLRVQNAEDLNWPDAAMKIREGTVLALMPGQAQNVFIPQVLLGVNAKSPLAAEAADFVKLAMSAPVQKLKFNDGLPVNVSAFEEVIQNPFMEGDDGMQGMVEVNGESRILQAIWPDAAVMRSFMDMALGLTTPSTMDPVLLQMIVDETAPYFQGEKDLSEAVDAVVQRTQAYLSE